ncbi:MAG: BglG family transcription antiterminator LicT [Eubacteriaceae bacterium]|jgi:beta-glucoside operon transcriptional antiterminator
MEIKKILNNNVVVTENKDGGEIIVMGRGLAFKAKAGQTIDESKIDKTFTLGDGERDSHFIRLLGDMDMSEFDFAEEMINFAKMDLGKNLSNTVYVTLIDHINTCKERAEAGAYINNTMLWDMKRLYKDEFRTAREIVRRMNVRFGAAFDDNEAATIATHLVNAEMDTDLGTVIRITRVITEILNIVKYHFNIVYDEDSLAYYRFMTHLRFFAERIFTGKGYTDDNDELFQMIIEKYPDMYECTLRISDFIEDKYQYKLENEEALYLTVHIAKVVRESRSV